MATVEDFQLWQHTPYVHALTCGNCTWALNPVAADVDGGVLLVCPNCDYLQIPAEYLHRFAANMKEYRKPFEEAIKMGAV